MKKFIGRYLLGLFLIVCGVGYLGNHLGFWSGFTIFFDGWWAILFIVAPAIVSMISDRINQGNITAAVIGILLFLSQRKPFEDMPVRKIIFCAVIILLGLGLIFKPMIRGKKKSNLRYIDNDAVKDNQRVLFSSSTITFDGRTFEGGEYTVSFGALVLDLRGAMIPHDCELRVNVSFGAVEILLPDGTALIDHTGSFFGGVDNHRSRKVDPNLPKVFLTGSCVFGGIETN